MEKVTLPGSETQTVNIKEEILFPVVKKRVSAGNTFN